MAQNNLDYSQNPSGVQLMDTFLAGMAQNSLTMNSGVSRPAYAVAGTFWLDTSQSPWVLKQFNGTSDVVFGTLNQQDLYFTASRAVATASGTNIDTALASKAVYPPQTGQNGKFLTTNGTAVSWGTVDLSGKADINSPGFTGVPTAPTATATTNSTQIATTAFMRNVLTTIYPVGSVFLSTTSTCPLASLFGSWQNIGTKLLTDVSAATSIACRGNGISVGWTNGSGTAGTSTGSARMEPTIDSYGRAVTTDNVSERIIGGIIGITTDSSKSGIIGDTSNILGKSSITVNIFKRTA